jgi:hypothetical protein
MGSSDGLTWGPPTYSNKISTSNTSTLSYKMIKIAYGYLTSAAQDPIYLAPTKTSVTFNTFDLLGAILNSPSITTPRQPPVPVMPEQLT